MCGWLVCKLSSFILMLNNMVYCVKPFNWLAVVVNVGIFSSQIFQSLSDVGLYLNLSY